MGSFLALIWIFTIVIDTTISECTGNGNFSCTESQSTQKNGLETCRVFSSCSQKCNDTEGFVTCSCIDGFKLEIDNRTCTAINPDWKLLYWTDKKVGLIYGRKRYQKINSINTPVGTFLGVTYDARRNQTFWTVSGEEVSSISPLVQYLNFNEQNANTMADSGIGHPADIASDWITGNVYLADSRRNEIVVCNPGVNACSIIVTQSVNSIQDLVLDPNHRIMFWTNKEGNHRIMRADMDGENLVTILQSNLKVINGLAIDQGGSRLYWIDTKFDKLESCLLDGRDRRVIIAGKRLFSNAFIIDIFGDQVFWGNRKTDVVFSANKFTGSDMVAQFVNQERGEMKKGRIVHVASQPISALNPCEETACSHICVISRNSAFQFRCVCPVGMHIDPRDEKTCVETKDFPKLAIAYGAEIHLLPIGSIGKSLTETISVPGIHSIKQLLYNPVNNSLVLKDALSYIYEFKLDGKTLRNISMNADTLNMFKMDIDAVSGNLYWIDPQNKTLETMSLRTGARTVVNYGMENITAFAIRAEMGSAFFTVKNNNERILYQISLDGSNSFIVQFLGENGPPFFAIDGHTGTSYYYERSAIWSVSSTREKHYVGYKFPHSSLDFVSEENIKYFVSIVNVIRVEADYTLLYNVNYKDEVSGQADAVLALIKNTPSLQMWSLLYKHECSEKSLSYKQCSHICVMSHLEEFQGICHCPSGIVLGADNKTCEMLPTCNEDQFRCQDNKCINMDLVCDQVPDCSEREDEINCKNQLKCPEKMFHCGVENTLGSCIPKSRVCDGVRDCENGEDEKCSKYSCQSSEYYCEATDTCVHKSWLCSSFNSTTKFYKCPGITIRSHVDEVCRDHNGDYIQHCGNERFSCYDSSRCFDRYYVCDGSSNCDDGSDEAQNMCSIYSYRSRYYG